MASWARIPLACAMVVAAMVVAALAAHPAEAASCAGNSHAMSLSDGRASPGSGSTSTSFTFRVTYTDNDACAPNTIAVRIPGVGTFNLAYVAGNLQAGATFGRSLQLPPGTWAYRFEAASGSGAGARTATFTKVDPATVLVTRKTPKPTPTDPPPVPTPAPTRHPIASPTPAAPGNTATPRPTGATGSPAPTRSPGPAPTSVGPIGPATPTTGVGLDLAGLPRPLLAAIVASIGTVGGLAIFGLLGTRLLRPASASVFPIGGRRKRGGRPRTDTVR